MTWEEITFSDLNDKSRRILKLNHLIKKPSENLLIIYCLLDSQTYKKVNGMLKKLLNIYENHHFTVFHYVYDKIDKNYSIECRWKKNEYEDLNFNNPVNVVEFTKDNVKYYKYYSYERFANNNVNDGFPINVDNMKVIYDSFKSIYKNINCFLIDESDKSEEFDNERGILDNLADGRYESKIDNDGDILEFRYPKYKQFDVFDVGMFHKFGEK
jgi:hypothetical protein